MLTDIQITALLRFHELGPLRRWQRVEPGGINPAFIVNDDIILRLNVREPESHKFHKEAALYRRLRSETGLPVPEVLVFDASRSILPYDVLMLARLDGVNALHAWQQLDATAQEQISYDLGQALAILHTIDCTGYGGFNLQKEDLGNATDWRSYLLDKTAETMVQLWFHEGLPPALLEGCEAYVCQAPIPSTPPPVLVHGDFGLHNALIARRGTGWQLSGLFDFEWALAADAEYEFATGLLVEPDEVNPLILPFLAGYRSQRSLAAGWEQRSAIYRLIYHLTLCAVVCRFYRGDPGMLRYHRGMIVDILKAGL